MSIWTIVSFLLFTGGVAYFTWLMTRKGDHESKDGFFLAGRSLSFPFIAGSLLLTNLSTEQLVGLNGDAFTDGLSVMAWEVVAVVALVLMALFFLPKFLRSGITTVPQYLANRFDKSTELICNIIFLAAYAVILLPIILYTGATGMMGVLDLRSLLGIESEMVSLSLLVVAVGVIGAIYALWGGLKSVAVSDTLNGIGLLSGGFIITYYGIKLLGDGSFGAGMDALVNEGGTRFNSVGASNAKAPFEALFTGILLINVFYWCTNQQIIQRTFGAKSLAEGQKGVLLTGALKLLGPLYLVLPGIIAAMAFGTAGIKSDHAYGMLVSKVLPAPLLGFFAAALLGAILSSFNSALNSTSTLFSLGLYKGLWKPEATEAEMVRAGRYFGWGIAAVAMIVAPLLAGTGGIFSYLQKMNAIYFIPILAVVVVGMLSKRVPSFSARIALVGGIALIALGYFIPPFNRVLDVMQEYHFVALVFVLLVLFMVLMGQLRPSARAYENPDARVTDLTPWKYANVVGVLLLLAVIAIYGIFADFSVL